MDLNEGCRYSKVNRLFQPIDRPFINRRPTRRNWIINVWMFAPLRQLNCGAEKLNTPGDDPDLGSQMVFKWMKWTTQFAFDYIVQLRPFLSASSSDTFSGSFNFPVHFISMVMAGGALHLATTLNVLKVM